MEQQTSFIERHFLWVLSIFTIVGLFLPKYCAWLQSTIHFMLALIAFCVGLTLKPENYKHVWKNKKIILTVLLFKYLTAPLLTFLFCRLANIPNEYIVALVILMCCPAANTGNIMCYLAKGNTAMIVTTTILGALLSPLITPVIIFILLNKIVHIKYDQIMLTIATGVAIPMLSGMLASHFFSKKIALIKPLIPPIAIIAVSIIIAAILSQHAQEILRSSLILPALCVLLIILFLMLGYYFSTFIKAGEKNAIAMAFEVGTFDGVLGILLALQIIGDKGILPIVLFAVLNLMIGSIAAQLFSVKKLIQETI